MSSRNGSIADTLCDYILEQTLRDRPELRAPREETAQLPNAGMQISPDQGQLMALLAWRPRARRSSTSTTRQAAACDSSSTCSTPSACCSTAAARPATTRPCRRAASWSTTRSGGVWCFDTATEAFTELGEGAPGEHGYTTSMVVDPTGRLLYHVPGAHGGIADEGTPVMQFDVERRSRKVIVFLAPFCRAHHGYTPDGTFAVDLTPDGATLYITWNGNRIGASGSKDWDTCTLTVLHLPEAERGQQRPV